MSALVDPKTLADQLGTKVGYVYAHADELGAIRLGKGPKARLRFDPERALERLNVCTTGRRSEHPEPAQPSRSRARRSPASGTRVELLPIRGSRRAA